MRGVECLGVKESLLVHEGSGMSWCEGITSSP